LVEEPGNNLVLVLGAWFTAITTGNTEHLAGILHPDVEWYGPHPWQSCHGRDQALEFLSRSVSQPRRITSLHAYESGDEVIATAEGPDFEDIGPTGETTPRPTATPTLTVRDRLIVKIQGG
jgi:ketosteroid isomerase-like protein